MLGERYGLAAKGLASTLTPPRGLELVRRPHPVLSGLNLVEGLPMERSGSPCDNYSKLGYGRRRTGFGTRPVVLVVDFQKGLTDPAFPMGGTPAISEAVESTASLLHVARDADVPVFHCRIAFGKGDLVPRWKIDSLVELLQTGHQSTEIDERILDSTHDRVITKRAASLFFQTDAYRQLAEYGADTVLVAGCATSGCVRATVTDAFSYGLRVSVPRECVADFDVQAHENSLLDIDRRYGDVVTLREVKSYLAQLPRISANVPSTLNP